ncbi:MAG: Crp/Fnr family transcriptional regulator [Pseudomonadota bacterium]
MTTVRTHSDVVAAVRKAQWLAGVDESTIETIASNARIRRYPVDSYVFAIGDPCEDVYGVLSGRVRIKLTSEAGQEFAIIDQTENAWFGEFAIPDGTNTRNLDAQTIEEADVVVVPAGVIRDAASKNPIIYQQMIGKVINDSRGIYQLLSWLSFYPLRSRLARRLVMLANDHGQENELGTVIELKMSQSDFALLSLGSRQRVNMILSEWRERGIVDKRSARYVILDIDALKREVDVEDDD